MDCACKNGYINVPHECSLRCCENGFLGRTHDCMKKNTRPWWREFFEDIFPKPQEYQPKDRTLSQLQHIHNGDTTSEAVDDYKAEREEAEASLQQARYEHLEAYTEKLVAETTRRTWEEAIELSLTDYSSGSCWIIVQMKKKIESLK
jgi:hypothetical protein